MREFKTYREFILHQYSKIAKEQKRLLIVGATELDVQIADLLKLDYEIFQNDLYDTEYKFEFIEPFDVIFICRVAEHLFEPYDTLLNFFVKLANQERIVHGARVEIVTPNMKAIYEMLKQTDNIFRRIRASYEIVNEFDENPHHNAHKTFISEPILKDALFDGFVLDYIHTDILLEGFPHFHEICIFDKTDITKLKETFLSHEEPELKLSMITLEQTLNDRDLFDIALRYPSVLKPFEIPYLYYVAANRGIDFIDLEPFCNPENSGLSTFAVEITPDRFVARRTLHIPEIIIPLATQMDRLYEYDEDKHMLIRV